MRGKKTHVNHVKRPISEICGIRQKKTKGNGWIVLKVTSPPLSTNKVPSCYERLGAIICMFKKQKTSYTTAVQNLAMFKLRAHGNF